MKNDIIGRIKSSKRRDFQPYCVYMYKYFFGQYSLPAIYTWPININYIFLWHFFFLQAKKTRCKLKMVREIVKKAF